MMALVSCALRVVQNDDNRPCFEFDFDFDKYNGLVVYV